MHFKKKMMWTGELKFSYRVFFFQDVVAICNYISWISKFAEDRTLRLS